MSARRFVSNASWTLGSQVIPLLIAIITIPLLLRAIGIERFGFLSIAWMLIGYAGLFDLGVRGAVTRVVAERVGAAEPEGAHAVARSAIFVAVIIGVVLCCVMQLLTGLLTTRWLGLSPALAIEADTAMRLLALSLPIVLLTNVYGGILAGYQAFRKLGIVLMAMGVFNYLAPFVVTLFSVRLEALVGVLVLTRLVTNQLLRRVCRQASQMTREWEVPTMTTLRPLFRLGGWMSVSKIVGPLLSTMDRLILAGKVPVATLAFYTTPADMTSKLQTFPNAVFSMMIPAMASMQGNVERIAAAYYTSARFAYSLMLPAVLVLVVMAEPVMRLWLGAEFAAESYRVLQWFAVGVFLYTLAQPAAVVLLGAGNPKWIALTQVVELPVLVLVLFALVDRFGIEGAAMTWALRNAIDAVVFTWYAHRWVLRDHVPMFRVMTHTVVAGGLLLAAAALDGNLMRLMYAGVALLLLAIYLWMFTLSEVDRARVRPWLARIRSQA